MADFHLIGTVTIIVVLNCLMLYHVLVTLDRLVVIRTDVLADTDAASQTFHELVQLLLNISIDAFVVVA